MRSKADRDAKFDAKDFKIRLVGSEISQYDLAIAAGINYSTVNAICNGHKTPTVEQVKRLEDVFQQLFDKR